MFEHISWMFHLCYLKVQIEFSLETVSTQSNILPLLLVLCQVERGYCLFFCHISIKWRLILNCFDMFHFNTFQKSWKHFELLFPMEHWQKLTSAISKSKNPTRFQFVIFNLNSLRFILSVAFIFFFIFVSFASSSSHIWQTHFFSDDVLLTKK